MLCLLDIALASVFFAANMGNLLVHLISEITPSELEVNLVIVFLLKLAVVLVILCNLQENLSLLLLVLVVWIDLCCWKGLLLVSCPLVNSFK